MDREELVLHINALADHTEEWVSHERAESTEEQLNHVKQCRKALLGEIQFSDVFLDQLRFNNTYYYTASLLSNVLNGTHNIDPIPFDQPDFLPVFKKLIKPIYIQGDDQLSDLLNECLSKALRTSEQGKFDQVLGFCEQQSFDLKTIVKVGVEKGVNYFVQETSDTLKNIVREQMELSPFGKFIVSTLEEKNNLLGLLKKEETQSFIESIIFEDQLNTSVNEFAVSSWLRLLFQFHNHGLSKNYTKYLFYLDSWRRRKYLNLESIIFLINCDAQGSEGAILNAIREVQTTKEDEFSVYFELEKKLPNQYDGKIKLLGASYLKIFTGNSIGLSYFYEQSSINGPLTGAYFDYLFEKDPDLAEQTLIDFIEKAYFVSKEFLKHLAERFKIESLPYLLRLLAKDPSPILKVYDLSFYNDLFKLIEPYDLKPHLSEILDCGVKSANRRIQGLIAEAVSQYDEAKKLAIDLLGEKKVDQRVLAAMILSKWGSEDVLSVLDEALSKENNDATRDIMLDSLISQRFPKPYTYEQVIQMVELAGKRKKLARWGEKWLKEEELPKLYWSATDNPLTEEQVRFLFYRMKRAKGINSDIEAKQLIGQLDVQKSIPFAKALISSFLDSNSDNKLKYYLTIAGLIGNDEIAHSLNTVFKKNIADKRMKMAQYVVGSLAMVGTDKALRMVEAIYRKFANKRPQVSQSAQDALTAAATELGITMDELSDRIVPDFGFEELYKNFVVEGEEYRAFISADFKLNYLNEDNKIRKSIPPKADKEIKKEFKEIEKEIREVIKSQSIRLEKYLVESRQWKVNEWRELFFQNPIMFVYGLKLLWGVFDEKGQLINSFYCAEDTGCYDIADEEIEIEEAHFIRIIHPIYLTENQRNLWKEKIYELSLITLFPILDRPVLHKETEELDKTFVNRFNGKDVPQGADFVNTFLMKRNWLRSTGDGGRSEFTKSFSNGALFAFADIDGPTVFYQEGQAKATVNLISFYGKDWEDMMTIKDVPAIFYSEVVSDIDEMIKS